MNIGVCYRDFVAGVAILIATASIQGQTNQISFTHDDSGNRLLARLTGTNAPTITTPNLPETVHSGEVASFSVLAQGTGPMSYQWRLNGSNITGATNATLFLTNAAGSDGGLYSVIVSNAGGSVTNDAGSLTLLATEKPLYRVTYGNDLFVAVGGDGTIVTSPDRYAWGEQTSGTATNLFGVAFGNDTFVAVGTGGTVLSSSDGTNWTSRSSTTTDTLGAVTYGGGQFVAVGEGARIITSSDGVTWTSQTSDDPTILGVVYGNNLYVATGSEGEIFPSSDGETWYITSSGTTASLNGITYGDGKYVAVGSGGTVVVSTNGINWSEHSSGTIATFFSVYRFNEVFFAVGPSRTNFVSIDGTTWAATDSGTTEVLYDLTEGAGTLLAVGDNGEILEVPPPALDHFDWDPISSPQRISQSFSATITAKDVLNRTYTNFAETVNLSATRMTSPSTNSMFGNAVHWGTNTLDITLGNSFTPNANLLVTHVRHYFGTKVAIWTDVGELLASQDVTSTPGTWVETQLSTPIHLSAGKSYIVAVYSGGSKIYVGLDMAVTFQDGTIDQCLRVSGDGFPGVITFPYRWAFVDLLYSVEQTEAASVTPTVTGAFANGVWTGNVTVEDSGKNVSLVATDEDGHTGVSQPFEVLAANDLYVTLDDTPDPTSVGGSLNYFITVNNPGPSSATSVNLTNTLPSGVSFVSATPSQGSCNQSGNLVTCSLGTIASLGSATVSIEVTPTSAGVLLTNTSYVARGEADADAANNTAVSITQVLPALSINDVSVDEGDSASTNAQFTITLSGASIQPVFVDYATADGTATAGTDYIATNGFLAFAPGETTKQITVVVLGDVAIGPDETFLVNLSNPENASISDAQGVGNILNDDGLPGNVNYFTWSTIPSPQRTNQSFSATITGKDIDNNTATNFNGTVTISGIGDGSVETGNILGGPVHTGTQNVGTFTIGYSFTPSTNLTARF
jgi:uncharacterized repeat protein (TIGR01451 family)